MSLEEVKNFWNTRPCNINHSNHVVGSKEYFDEVEQRKYFVEPHLPKFADFARWAGKKVLEIGCGLGTESINFARSGADLTIIELSEKSLELCKKRFKAYNLSATFILGNAEDISTMSFNTKFDLVWAWGVIHHTPNPEMVVDGIKQHLKQDGEFRMMVYSKISYKLFWAMHESNTWEMSKAPEVIKYFAEAQHGCPVAYTYSFNDIKVLLKDYELVEMHKDHIFTWDIPNYINKKYVKDKAWKNVSEKDLKAFEKELGWHTLVVSKLAVATTTT